MYLLQSDLLRGMDREFIKEFLDIAVKESHEKGEFLFHRGQRASDFYILLKGFVRLVIGDTGHVVHVVDHAGEAFGWSSLVGRDLYSTSAECLIPTKVIRVENDKCFRMLAKYPDNGIVFFQHLARSLGDRLIRSYEQMADTVKTNFPISFGTGRMTEPDMLHEPGLFKEAW